MARLDPNTTLNGNQIWHAGNFDPTRVINAFYIQAGQTAYGNTPGVTLALGDHDTGLQWVSDGTFAVYSNGAERVRFASTGNVGIGTATPSSRLHVAGTMQVDGAATFSTSLVLPSIYGTNTIRGGSGDSNTYATHNVRLQSWWGIGFEDHAGGINGVYDARTGIWKVKGGYTLAPSDAAGVATQLTQDGDKTLRITNVNGYVEIGAKNTGAAHLYTDRPYWALNKPLVAQTFFQLGDGSQTFIGLTTGTINGQAIVVTNDTRLKSWGNLAVSGNTLQRLGTDMIGSDGTSLYLNQSGGHTGGVKVTGTLGMSSAVRWDSTTNFGSDYAQISYQSDNNTYAIFGDSTENGTLIIESGNDTTSGTAAADVIVLKSAATIVDGGVGSRLRVMNPDGYVEIGAQNTSAFHFITDRPFFYFNKDISAVNSIGVYGSSTTFTATSGTIGGNRVLTTGTITPGFVEGSRTLTPTSGDLNLLNATGVYNHSAPTNGIASDWTYVLHMAHSDDPANWGVQIAQHFHTDLLKTRRRTAGGWQPWQTIWTSATFDPASKANLSGATFTGQVTAASVTSGAMNISGDSIYRRSGQKGMIFHLPAANQAILAFEATAGANNWDWPNQYTFDANGTFTATAISTKSLNVTANAMNLRAGSSDHAYISFYPRTSEPTARGGFIGFPSPGTTEAVWLNELTGTGISLAASLTLKASGVAALVASASSVTTPVRVGVTSATGAVDASLYARANVTMTTTDGSQPALGFIRSGTDAIALTYKGGNDLYLQYTSESRLWHSNNFNPASKVDTTDSRLKNWGLFSTNGGQDFLGRGGRILVAGDNGSGGPGPLYINFGSDFSSTTIYGLTRIVKSVGATDNGSYARSTLLLESPDSAGNPALAFHKPGHSAVAMIFRGNMDLILRDGGSTEVTMWHGANFNPASKADLTGATFTGTVTATDFIKSSRREWKQDIAPYSADALTELDALDIVTFRYRNAPDAEHVGIIADDTANPHVSGEKRDGFNTGNTTAILVRAVQQLLRRVEDLEAQLGDR